MDSNNGVKIENVGGDVIGAGVSGIGNIIGKNVNVDISGTVTIESQVLNKLPEEYAEAFRAFAESINEQIKKENITPPQIQPIKESINELAKETEGLTPDKEPSILKKQTWKEKFFRVVKKLVPILPKTAETIAVFTPLSPFSKIIGESIELLVEGIQKEL
jgi:uncharacterized coiled-coil DUF342 family protein